MKFGEALQALFDAHIRDANSPKENCTRYTNAELKEEFKKVSNDPKWKIQLHNEFEVLYYTLQREILSCKHENVILKYDWMEQCQDCLCHRTKETISEPSGWGSAYKWSDWKIGSTS